MSEQNKTVELKDEELENVSAGGYHGELDACDLPNRDVYTVEHRLIWPGLLVRRVADGKGFRCSGYENCSDNSTLWVFHNDNGTEENLIYRAQISNEVISYFCMT